jgi:hypothetical protein
LKNFYSVLSVGRDASAEDIKKAFRREIARYHPDKVQHLGEEFQEMAAGIAADLTEAYRILMNPALRAKYDTELGEADRAEPIKPAPRPAAARTETARPAPPPRAEAAPAPPPPRPTAGVDFVRRVTMSKIKEAIADVFGSAAPMSLPGFDLAVVTQSKKGLFRKGQESVCLAVKFVPLVDGEAVAAAWPAAARVNAHGAAGCVLLLTGPALAPAKDLAAAVSEQRRKSRGRGPVLVPLDVRDWGALFPPETPASVRSLIQRLKDGKR